MITSATNVSQTVVLRTTAAIIVFVFIYFYFNVWARQEVHRAQSHTACTTQIDNNRHKTFCNDVRGRTTGLQTLS